MFEYKINVCNGIQKRYIYASDGSWIFFEDGEEATEEQKATHVAYEQAQVTEQDKQDKLSQLELLKKDVSDMEEAKLKRDGDVLTTEKQAVIDNKCALRTELEAMGETFDCCINENGLNHNDTTRLQLLDMVEILIDEIDLLKGGN